MPTGTGAEAPTDGLPEDGDVLLLDTSAAVALVLADHEAHDATLAAVRGHRLGLAGHAWFETYSVLTRLPGGLRRSPADAVRLLAHDFPASAHLGEAQSAVLGSELAALHISGGAVYDALVGAAARQHGGVLLCGDGRARTVYEALGTAVRIVRGPESAAAPAAPDAAG